MLVLLILAEVRLDLLRQERDQGTVVGIVQEAARLARVAHQIEQLGWPVRIPQHELVIARPHHPYVAVLAEHLLGPRLAGIAPAEIAERAPRIPPPCLLLLADVVDG